MDQERGDSKPSLKLTLGSKSRRSTSSWSSGIIASSLNNKKHEKLIKKIIMANYWMMLNRFQEAVCNNEKFHFQRLTGKLSNLTTPWDWSTMYLGGRILASCSDISGGKESGNTTLNEIIRRPFSNGFLYCGIPSPWTALKSPVLITSP